MAASWRRQTMPQFLECERRVFPMISTHGSIYRCVLVMFTLTLGLATSPSPLTAADEPSSPSFKEVTEIVTFLGSLTGPLPESFANAPVLPAAGFRPEP